ncbi:hypothetical protein [Enterococcus sp. C50]|uniref:hypothetical protein n=1 Tax=unclassified Enterococcus TaxID=2608891 RepID=UPI0034A0202F
MANKELVLIKEQKKKNRAKRLEEIRVSGKIISVTTLIPFYQENSNLKEGEKKYDV